MNAYVQQRRDKQSRSSADRADKSFQDRTTSAFGHHPSTLAQRKAGEDLNDSPGVQALTQLKQSLNQSPRMVAQAKLAASLQLKSDPMTAFADSRVEEEELLQGKFEAVQRQGDLEEEELLQGRFAAVQRQDDFDEEELLQGKFATAQLQDDFDEEELLQGKLVQRQGDLDEEELLQGKFATIQRQDFDEDELLQGKFYGTDPTQFANDSAPAPNQTGMPEQLKTGLEHLSGMDLSSVRVHHNSSKPAQLNALAYAQGQDIHIGPRQEQHLPHEGWHAVQQMQGRVKPTMQAKGVSINDDPGLEREADVMGAKAVQMHRSQKSPFEAPVRGGIQMVTTRPLGNAGRVSPPSAQPVVYQQTTGTEANLHSGIRGPAQMQTETEGDSENAGPALHRIINRLSALVDEAESLGGSEGVAETEELRTKLEELTQIANGSDAVLKAETLAGLQKELAPTPIPVGRTDSDTIQKMSSHAPVQRLSGYAIGGIILGFGILVVSTYAYVTRKKKVADKHIQEALKGVRDEDLRQELLDTWELLSDKGDAYFESDSGKHKGGYDSDLEKLILRIPEHGYLQSDDTTIDKNAIAIHELTHVAEVIANTGGNSKKMSRMKNRRILDTDIAKADDIIVAISDQLDVEENVFKQVPFTSSSSPNDKTLYGFLDDRLKYVGQLPLTELPTVVNQIVYVLDAKGDKAVAKTLTYKMLVKLQSELAESRDQRFLKNSI